MKLRPRSCALCLPLVASVVLALLGGCGAALERDISDILSQPVPYRTDDPAAAQKPPDSEVYRYPDIANADGSITRVLWLTPGMGKAVSDLLREHPDWVAANPAMWSASDPKSPSSSALFRDPNVAQLHPGWKDASGLEPLLLRGPTKAVDQCAKLVQTILGSIPQIVIEARAVEVVESDEFALGFEWFSLERDDHPFNPANPYSALSPTDTIFDRARLGRGVPGLPGGTGSFIPNILTELGTIQEDVQIDLLISALKLFTKVDVVNAPNVAVLSGHAASVTAGQEVPYFELNVAGANTVVSVKFKQVNISLDVLPTMIRPDTIRMAVEVKVQNVTGATTITSGSSEAVNPVIANRSVTTTMDVRDGATVVLGGLISTSRLGGGDRVPVLGEIPLVGVLFSSRHTQDARTNLIFFIRPKIITPDGQRARTLITPAEPPAPEPAAK